MQDDDASGGRGARPFAGGGYEPTRKSRLRTATEPPPLPPAAPEIDDGDRFGDAPEDGLRMLAALETLTSLEPDFCDDLTAEEASVTIIERVGHDPHDMEAAGSDQRSLRARLQDARPQDRGDYADDDGDESGPYRSLADEAVVEIVQIGDVATDFAEPADEPQLPVAQERQRGRATSRFFKALSGR